MSAAYRSDDETLREKIRELRRQYLQELFDLSPIFFNIYKHRMGRIWAGLAGVLGAAWLVLNVLHSCLWLNTGPSDWSFSFMLFGAVLFPLVAYFLSQLFVGRILLRKLLLPYRYEGDAHLIIEQLKNFSVQQKAENATKALERLSIAMPLVALSLLAPLTIHMIVSLLFVSAPGWSSGFSVWILGSFIMVGHCHLLLAWLSWRYCSRVSSATVEEFTLLSGCGWRAFGYVVASSFLSGIFLGFFFPVLMLVVGVTGILFIPAMFGWARNALAFERTELELVLDLKQVIKR